MESTKNKVPGGAIQLYNLFIHGDGPKHPAPLAPMDFALR